MLLGGEALARCAQGAPPAALAPALALVDLTPADTRPLAERAVAEAEGLASSLVM